MQPTFLDWAFNRKKGAEINKHWKLIPNYNAGCEMLLKKVTQIKPKLHVFGHIHEGYGMIEKGETIFVNASSVNFNYQLVNAPIVLEI